MRDITYCTCTECPFKDCETHPNQLKDMKGYASFASLYRVCTKYIEYLINLKE